MRLRLGTRGSALARAQSGTVCDALAAGLGRPVELRTITTYGDTSAAPLASLGGTGVFVNALREALLAGEVDLVVHSLKDLPTAAPEGLVLAAVPAREDPRDVLVSAGGRTLGELGSGARVGTGSPRRAAQLRAIGLGLRVLAVRGNVDTRLRMVSEAELDAVVLARAGLARLDRLGEVSEVLDPLLMLPAPGQGALAVECRAEDVELAARLSALLEDRASRLAVTAERALLATLEAGCSAPVGALAVLAEPDPADGAPGGAGEIYLRAVAVTPDGTQHVRRSATARVDSLDDARVLGEKLAHQMIDDGAGDLLAALHRERVP